VDLHRGPGGEGRPGRHGRAFDLPGIDTDPRFQDGRSRRDNAGEITAMFDAAFARFTKDEIAARLTAEEMCGASANAGRRRRRSAGPCCRGNRSDPGKDGIGSFASPAAPAKFHGVDDVAQRSGSKAGRTHA